MRPLLLEALWLARLHSALDRPAGGFQEAATASKHMAVCHGIDGCAVHERGNSRCPCAGPIDMDENRYWGRSALRASSCRFTTCRPLARSGEKASCRPLPAMDGRGIGGDRVDTARSRRWRHGEGGAAMDLREVEAVAPSGCRQLPLAHVDLRDVLRPLPIGERWSTNTRPGITALVANSGYRAATPKSPRSNTSALRGGIEGGVSNRSAVSVPSTPPTWAPSAPLCTGRCRPRRASPVQPSQCDANQGDRWRDHQATRQPPAALKSPAQRDDCWLSPQPRQNAGTKAARGATARHCTRGDDGRDDRRIIAIRTWGRHPPLQNCQAGGARGVRVSDPW